MEEEQKLEISRAKIFGLVKPIAGAIIGIIFFFILVYLSYLLKEKYIIFAFMSLGMFVSIILDLLLNLNNKVREFLVVAISAVPYAILGSLFFSKNNLVRIGSIIFLVIYFVFSFFLGILLERALNSFFS